MEVARAAYATVCSAFSDSKPDQILNPICALFWLAMLDWEKDGVKIGVIDNKVTYYPPGEDQANKRRADGVGRGDLGYFLPALERVRKFWGSDRNPHIIEVATRAIRMLDRLKYPYTGDKTILSCVGNYQRILEDVLNGKGGVALASQEQAEKQCCEDTLEEARGLLAKVSTKALPTLIVDNQEKYLAFMLQQAPPPRMTSSYPPRSFPAALPVRAPAAAPPSDASSPQSASSSNDTLAQIADQLHAGSSPVRSDRAWPVRNGDGEVVGYRDQPPVNDAEF